MRIAQVAPLYESVPPSLYGGTERVVHYLTEQLVSSGHEVTLFASGDSRTTAELVPLTAHSLRLHNTFRDPIIPHVFMLDTLRRLSHNFDIVHFHLEYLQFLITPYLETPHVTTVHGNLQSQESKLLLDCFNEEPLVSISHSQRKPVPDAHWINNIYHGLPTSLYQPSSDDPEDYLVFLGRISPEKRLDRAIKIAEASHTRLVVAAKIDAHDKTYFDTHIKHLLKSDYVHFVDEVDDLCKAAILSRAKALLFPIDWAEPFGLVMIEALACGVPVIAFANGSVPEVIENGVSGFVVHNLEQAFFAVKQLHLINRRDCRQAFKERFSSERMTQDYLTTYQYLIENFSDTERFHTRFTSQHGQSLQQ